MRKILIVFAHPRLEGSRINVRLLDQIPKQENITFHDLYERYPDFDIDIEYEKSLLSEHEIIVWHHPLYWYSSPPLLKQWIDMVLEYGWAYGDGGTALESKIIFNAFTSGGNQDAYCPEGYNCFTINDFLRPFEQTAKLCLMEYLPPFAVMGTHQMKIDQIESAARDYGNLLKKLGNGDFDVREAISADFLNEILR